jgi:DNA-directed RNA polymerase subunit RPC12/RpoP
MAGGALIVMMVACGLAGGIIGRVKGSSFLLWFAICCVPPFVGLIAALLYRFETEEPETVCPRCGKTVKLYEALCTRCGRELDPGYTAESAPAAASPPA